MIFSVISAKHLDSEAVKVRQNLGGKIYGVKKTFAAKLFASAKLTEISWEFVNESDFFFLISKQHFLKDIHPGSLFCVCPK